MNSDLNIVDLPEIVLEKILSCLTYDEISQNRIVCKKFDASCRALLNRGFIMAERKQSQVYRKLKACLPRRESERRTHSLARHCEILSALETRINMLSMTFMKFIDSGLCCFIPGKIIDEILTVLKVVTNSPCPPRTHDLLQELRDISSMAMEHFDEHIVPGLKALENYKAAGVLGASLSNGCPRQAFPEMLRRELKSIRQQSRSHRRQLNGLKKITRKLTLKVKRQNSMIAYQSSKLREQNKLIQEQTTNIAEMKRHMEEWDLKFANLTAELHRDKEEAKKNNEAVNNIASPDVTVTNEINNTSASLVSVNDIIDLSMNRSTNSFIEPSREIMDKIDKADNVMRRFRSNIKPRTGIPLHLGKLRNISNIKPREAQIFTKHNFHSQTDIRSNTTNPTSETIHNSTLSNKKSNMTVLKNDPKIECNARKRKVINLIANIANSKVPKTSMTDDPYRFVRKSDDFNSHNAVQNVIDLHNRGIKRHNELTINDTIPHKRYLDIHQ